MFVPQNDLERLISSRRTSKPSWFNDQEPDHAAVRNAIDVARKAPNHHRTEPARQRRTPTKLFAGLNADDVNDSSVNPHQGWNVSSQGGEWLAQEAGVEVDRIN